MAIPAEGLESFKRAVLDAKRPLIFFDDDADGLCSYLLCYRARGEGLGVRVHGSSTLTAEFARRVDENLPDQVVVLDKPQVEQAFLDHVTVPLVWLDHHEPQHPPNPNVTYLNPRVADDKDNRSTTYWVHKALGRPEDLWIAAVGSISDWQITEIADEFWKAYPDLGTPVATAPEALYKEPFATLTRLFQFNLKGDATEVRTAIKIFTRIESPYELLQHTTPRAKLLYKRYQHVLREYEKLLHAARASATDAPILLHIFAALEISLVSEVSNQLIHEYPEKIICIARNHNGEYKISIRSATREIASAVRIAMERSGARGNAGGHSHACGGRVVAEDFPRFFEEFQKAVGVTR